MELWIRSQNKRSLHCVRNIKINGLDIMCFGAEVLGTYSSEERALEVLNEIQELIQPTFITTGYDCKCKENPFDKLSFNLEIIPTKTEVKELSTYVYEMPKE